MKRFKDNNLLSSDVNRYYEAVVLTINYLNEKISFKLN